jgi:hypothetical protein
MSYLEKLSGQKILLLNSILVDDDVRPALLIQPVDYDETKSSDERTSSFIRAIQEQFPDLKSSSDYKGEFQGAIISKEDHNSKIVSVNEMGKILGYPCYKDFPPDSKKTIFYIDIVAYTQDGNIQILSNLCYDAGMVSTFKQIADAADATFKKEKYKASLTGIDIERVDIVVRQRISVYDIIHKLLLNDPLSPSEQEYFEGTLQNLDYLDLMDYDFRYDNPMHKGIIITLLLYGINDIISPFYPLSSKLAKKQLGDLKKITTQIESDLTKVLDRTLQPNLPPLSEDYIMQRFKPALRKLNFTRLIDYKFQYDNPIHKGIILALIINGDHNILDPLFGPSLLPQTRATLPQKKADVNDLVLSLESDLIDVLTKSQKPSSAASEGGTKRRIKKRKTRRKKTRK